MRRLGGTLKVDHNMRPVSYTHLDVYKRQGLGRPGVQEGRGMKRFVGFVGRVKVAHVVTYIAAGALAYPLLTREFFEGSAGGVK